VKNGTKSDSPLPLCIEYEQPKTICQEFFAKFLNNIIIFHEILNKSMCCYVKKISFISPQTRRIHMKYLGVAPFFFFPLIDCSLDILT
jgi:hypothetical protein